VSNEQSPDHVPPKLHGEETRAGQDKETDKARVGDRLRAEFLHPVETVATVIDIQKQNADLTTERVKSLLIAATNYGRGVHDMQLALVDMGVRSMELLQRGIQNLITCSNPTEVAVLQREMLREGMDQMLAGVTTVLQASSKAAEQASKPIDDHLKRLVAVERAA
jgi:hypothetical protein